MNILIVYAHPEARSLNASLKNFAVAHLQAAGHAVQVSDLYAMRWKCAVDADDSLDGAAGDRFLPSQDSQHAYATGRQSPDIAAEQEKLRWADAVVLQFPLWWYSMPAILKGWVDRVYACGFAYGVGEHSDTRWGDRFGEGAMAGKRAMVVVTAGGWQSHYSARGVNGPMDDILFPIHHGVLFYPGFAVMPPVVVYRTGKVDAPAFDAVCRGLGERLDGLFHDAPIAFRRQNAGDYLLPSLVLRDDLAAGREGFAAHVA